MLADAMEEEEEAEAARAGDAMSSIEDSEAGAEEHLRPAEPASAHSRGGAHEASSRWDLSRLAEEQPSQAQATKRPKSGGSSQAARGSVGGGSKAAAANAGKRPRVTETHPCSGCGHPIGMDHSRCVRCQFGSSQPRAVPRTEDGEVQCDPFERVKQKKRAALAAAAARPEVEPDWTGGARPHREQQELAFPPTRNL